MSSGAPVDQGPDGPAGAANWARASMTSDARSANAVTRAAVWEPLAGRLL